MTALRPFFLLIGRASVFWLSAVGLFVATTVVVGLAQPDARLALQVDPVFIAVFAFPASAGWLVGAVIQEFQHTTFAAVLPGVRFRIASGFLAAGLAVTVVVVGSVALFSSALQHLPVLFVVGLGAYCLGGILLDPLSAWITSLNVIVVLFVITSSRELARFAGDHPWMTVAVSCGVGLVCFFRLFARSTFRRKPLRATSPLPGRFSLEKTRRYERRRMVRDGARRTGWRPGYLGSDSWLWVRAAVHEVYGPRGWKGVSRSIGRAWAIALIFVVHAWADKGDMDFGEALARSFYDALFRSPYQNPFGEDGGPYLVVALVIATAGVVTALFTPVALNEALAYPLSRRQRARVLFRGGLVDGAIFLFVVGPCLFALGHLTGLLLGCEIRFDFMPFFFRALMVTLILMPLAHWGRFGLQAAARRKAENTLVAVIFGVTAFVVAVCAWTFASPVLLGSPALELATLVGALLVSQLVYRHKLTRYYRTTDLA